jgi:hypothetical protein
VQNLDNVTLSCCFWRFRGVLGSGVVWGRAEKLKAFQVAFFLSAFTREPQSVGHPSLAGLREHGRRDLNRSAFNEVRRCAV